MKENGRKCYLSRIATDWHDKSKCIMIFHGKIWESLKSAFLSDLWGLDEKMGGEYYACSCDNYAIIYEV